MGDSGRCDTENSADRSTKLIGRRVVVRHRVGDKLSDAVGELAVEGAGSGRPAPVVGRSRVARSAVTAVRAVPPPVPRRAALSAIARLEGAVRRHVARARRGTAGCLAVTRLQEGYTGRANAALAIGDHRGCRPMLLWTSCSAFADRHGITPRVQVPIGLAVGSGGRRSRAGCSTRGTRRGRWCPCRWQS